MSNISEDIVKRYGGNALLDHMFGGSLFEIFQDIYPHHQSSLLKALSKPQSGYWDSTESQRKFLDELHSTLGFKYPQDWYNITVKQIQENGGHSLLRKYGNSPSKVIASVYTEHPWDISTFNTNKL
jgi:hypothetical protein